LFFEYETELRIIIKKKEEFFFKKKGTWHPFFPIPAKKLSGFISR